MECDYVTPSFFRELEKEYQSGLRSEGGGLEGAEGEPEDRMAQLARGASWGPGWVLVRAARGWWDLWGAQRQGSVPAAAAGMLLLILLLLWMAVHQRRRLPRLPPCAAGMPQHSGDGGESDDDSEVPESSPATARSAISREASPQQPRGMMQLRDDLKAGWLEKRSGDSSNLNALPVDSWKWQRRW